MGEEVWTIAQPGDQYYVFRSGYISTPIRYGLNAAFGGWESYTGSYHPQFTMTLKGGGGVSGAPIFDRSGQVIGIEFADSSASASIARPLTHILSLIKAGILKGFPSTPYIGALFTNIANQGGEWSRKYHLLDMRGVSVFQVLPESPAADKMFIGDVIRAVKIGGRRTSVYTFDQLAAVIESCPVGKPITAELPRYNLKKQKWDSISQVIVVGNANADTARRTLQVVGEAIAPRRAQ